MEGQRELEAVASGSLPSLGELYDTYGKAVFAVAMRVTADRNFAEDVVQEVFLAIWRKPEAYDPSRGSLSSFLVGSAHHKAVDLVRREESLRRRRDRAMAEATEHQLVQESVPQVEVAVWENLRGEKLRAALADLPPAQREALLLAYFRGYTQREIAAITGVPLGTVKTRTLAAFRRLREALRDSVDDTGDSAMDALRSLREPGALGGTS